jgi:DNA polymerase III epsilon subunit-like protein
MNQPTLARYVLTFDFETNDLPKRGWCDFEPFPTMKMKNGVQVEIPATPLEEMPYAVQISYILYDTFTHKKKVFNEKIQLPEGVAMSAGSEAIHKMSLHENQTSSYPPMEEVLLKMKRDFERADILVAHNIQFDRNILLAELTRHQANPVLNEFLLSFYYNQKEFCTMKHGIYVCRIEAINRLGRKYFKLPKLSYLYEHLFGEKPEPDRLHDALYDVILCLRCFYKMKYNIDIQKEDPDILLKKRFSRRNYDLFV